MKQFALRWAATTIAVMVASSVIRGIRYDTVAALIGASLLLGILNAFVRPFLLILSAPVILLTLGLFILVLNGLLLLLVPSVVAGFHANHHTASGDRGKTPKQRAYQRVPCAQVQARALK